jgi:hypothetical protein
MEQADLNSVLDLFIEKILCILVTADGRDEYINQLVGFSLGAFDSFISS